jgi:hypothetical protein
MLRPVALVRTDVSVELSTPFIRVTIMDELETKLAIFILSARRLIVTAGVVPSSSFIVTLMKEALSSYELSFLT